MKKSLWALGAVVVIAVAVALVVSGQGDDTKKKTAINPIIAAAQKKEIKACEVLTPAIAKQVVGADATSSGAGNTQIGSSAVSVSNCAYYSVSSKSTVSLLARSALNSTGVNTNKTQFNSGLPGDAVKVSGYGDAAYWSPTFGQLNILKHNNWYILSVGPLNPQTRSQAQAESYAKLIIDQL